MPAPDPDLDAVLARHKAGHERDGTTYAIYFPSEAPWRVVEDLVQAISVLVYDVPRASWDPFMFGRGGDCDLVPHEEAHGD